MYERTDASVQTNAARPARAHGRTDAQHGRTHGRTGARTHAPIRDFAAALHLTGRGAAQGTQQCALWARTVEARPGSDLAAASLEVWRRRGAGPGRAGPASHNVSRDASGYLPAAAVARAASYLRAVASSSRSAARRFSYLRATASLSSRRGSRRG